MSNFTFSKPDEHFPKRLKQYDQWLVTRDKKPVAPSKGWNDLVNLLSFTEVQRKAEQLSGDVAFCFTECDPFVGFDLDGVTQEDGFTDDALDLVNRLDSYTEVSSSGTGLHVITEGGALG